MGLCWRRLSWSHWSYRVRNGAVSADFDRWNHNMRDSRSDSAFLFLRHGRARAYEV